MAERKLKLKEIYNRMEDENMDSLLRVAKQTPKPHGRRTKKADASKSK